MTREESINKAAVQYATHFIDTGETDFYGHFVKELGLDDAEHRGFIAGAKWADNNPKSGLIDLSKVWHDAKEEPEKGKLMIGIEEEDVSVYKWADQVEGDWLYFAECFGLIRWAYIDDLLPEGGEP